MDHQRSQHEDALARAPKETVRNTKNNKQVDDQAAQGFLRALARLLACPPDPSLSPGEFLALLLGSGCDIPGPGSGPRGNAQRRVGLISVDMIVAEAAKGDPKLYTKNKFNELWTVPKIWDALANLLLRDENLGHHIAEAADELSELALARRAGRNAMTGEELICRVCELDLKLHRSSPGYRLFLFMAAAARPGGEVAAMVTGMCRQVFRRWHDACRTAFDAFDIALRPGVTMEEFSRDLVDAAEGVAVRSRGTDGRLDAVGESDVSVLARHAMKLLVGVVDVGKTGVSLSDAVDALIEPAVGATTGGDVVAWRKADVPGQSVGRVGGVDLFVIDQQGPGRFMLGSRDPFGIDSDKIVFAPDPFFSAKEAQQAAEERTTRALRTLDLTPRRTA